MPSAEVSRALAADSATRAAEVARLVEDQWFDRKSFRVEPRRLAESLIALANADGGTLVVGITGGKIEGTRSNAQHRNALMQAAHDFTKPTVPVRCTLQACVNDREEADDLLVFEVQPSAQLHETVRDEVFLRVGDENRRLSFTQRRELAYDKGQATYEAESSGIRLNAVDEKLVANYAQRVGHPNGRRLLRARGLADGDVLTVAGCLLFAENPQQVLPNAHIRVTRFDGRERGTGARQRLRHDRRIEGPIPWALMAARQQIEQWQPRRRALGRAGSFEDVPLVPQDAWLEAVVNAAVHRSYSLGGDHIHVEIFDDRIEVESPGRFPGLVSIDNPLQVTRFARNPRIARVCADLRLGQELGEGIRRMFEEMRLAGLEDPLYRQTSGSVRLTLSGEPVERDLNAKLPAEAQLIIASLREAGQLGTGEVMELLGVARPTALRRLDDLRKAGLVERVGKSASDPRAHWRLTR